MSRHSSVTPRSLTAWHRFFLPNPSITFRGYAPESVISKVKQNAKHASHRNHIGLCTCVRSWYVWDRKWSSGPYSQITSRGTSSDQTISMTENSCTIGDEGGSQSADFIRLSRSERGSWSLAWKLELSAAESFVTNNVDDIGALFVVFRLM